MAGFLLALVGPLLYAVTNYLDKLLLDRYAAERSVAVILIFSALFSALALPLLFAADPTVFRVSGTHMLALAGVGVLNFLLLLFYLKALQAEDVATAIIFYQLVPVFAYGLGYLVLGETLTRGQLFAMLVILLGTSVVSFDLDEARRFRLRARTALYMLAASLCWALAAVLFKVVALEERVVRSLFWEHLVLAVIGTGLLIIPTYRDACLHTLRRCSRAIVGLAALNELAYVAANIVMAFAYLLAPVSVILLANSYQALFALMIGAVLTTIAPALLPEKARRWDFVQKGLAILVTAIGTYVLLRRLE
ncbi:MAG: EamA family transporter [Alphaproteobacteria bacterium]|nr:EamA family transporter [Alphaproteobacteria bacterium]